MFASFITPVALSFLRQGPGYPLWRLVTTLENAVIVNFIALAIILLSLFFVAWRIRFVNKVGEYAVRSRLTPFFVTVAFAVIPMFSRELVCLSPLLVGLVPAFLSAVVSVIPIKTRDKDRTVDCLRFVAAGALSAVSVWEGTSGLCLAPFLVVLICFPVARRENPILETVICWVAGFIAAFLLESQTAFCPWSALMPHLLPLRGFVYFAVLGVVPFVVVWWFGEQRWILALWGFVLIGVLSYNVYSYPSMRTSASEKLVRRMIGDLRGRKLILGDGRFDLMVDEFKPADVKRIGKTTAAEREYLLQLTEGGQPLTNKVLVVADYYDLDSYDFICALAETGTRYRKPTNLEQQRRQKNKLDRLSRTANALVDSLAAMNEKYATLPEEVRDAERSKAQANIRQGWESGFGGTRMSTTLLNIDIRNADRKTLESDALNALLVDRNDPAANSVMGQLRLEEGKLEEAEKYLRKGVKGGGTLAMSRLAMLLVNTERSKEAEEWARKCVALVPQDWNLRQPLVAALVENGKHDEALRELEALQASAAQAKASGAARGFVEEVKKRILSLKSQQ